MPLTGLYYLNSRYYDPQIGRFINADNVANITMGINGLNLYCYCYNSPLRFTDSLGTAAKDGHFDKWGTVSSFIDYIMASGLLLLKGLSNLNPTLSKSFSSISSFASAFSITSSIAGIAITTISNIYSNVKNGVSPLRTYTDAMVDMAAGISTVMLAAVIGAAIGSVIPGVGNVVGFIAGLGVGAFMYYIGDDLVDGFKDIYYNIVETSFNWVSEKVKRAWGWFKGLFN